MENLFHRSLLNCIQTGSINRLCTRCLLMTTEKVSFMNWWVMHKRQKTRNRIKKMTHKSIPQSKLRKASNPYKNRRISPSHIRIYNTRIIWRAIIWHLCSRFKIGNAKKNNKSSRPKCSLSLEPKLSRFCRMHHTWLLILPWCYKTNRWQSRVRTFWSRQVSSSKMGQS